MSMGSFARHSSSPVFELLSLDELITQNQMLGHEKGLTLLLDCFSQNFLHRLKNSSLR